MQDIFVTMVTEVGAGPFSTGAAGSMHVQKKCNEDRTACAWSVALPPTPGRYTVNAVADDPAGNRRRSSLDVVVVTPPRESPRLVPARRHLHRVRH